MYMRIGKVTNIHPTTGKINVMYDDESNASLPLAMLTLNNEYSMPEVGEKVVTIHMENGSSKGFVFGTYYGGGTQPKANAGYRKDFKGGAYVICQGGSYILTAPGKAIFKGKSAMVSLDENASLTGAKVLIGSVPASGEAGGDAAIGEAEPESYIEITEEDIGVKALTGIKIEAQDVTMKCSYGEITLEDLLKRLERAEDALGLPHTI